jgi:hypothetical protein
MIKKLRNQPYAPKWEQRGRKSTSSNNGPDWVLEMMKLLAQKMALIDSYYSVCVYEAFTSPGKYYVSETVACN